MKYVFEKRTFLLIDGVISKISKLVVYPPFSRNFIEEIFRALLIFSG